MVISQINLIFVISLHFLSIFISFTLSSFSMLSLTRLSPAVPSLLFFFFFKESKLKSGCYRGPTALSPVSHFSNIPNLRLLLRLPPQAPSILALRPTPSHPTAAPFSPISPPLLRHHLTPTTTNSHNPDRHPFQPPSASVHHYRTSPSSFSGIIQPSPFSPILNSPPTPSAVLPPAPPPPPTISTPPPHAFSIHTPQQPQSILSCLHLRRQHQHLTHLLFSPQPLLPQISSHRHIFFPPHLGVIHHHCASSAFSRASPLHHNQSPLLHPPPIFYVTTQLPFNL